MLIFQLYLIGKMKQKRNPVVLKITRLETRGFSRDYNLYSENPHVTGSVNNSKQIQKWVLERNLQFLFDYHETWSK